MKRSMKLSFVVLTVMCLIFMCNVAFAEVTPENVAVNSYINVDINGCDVLESYRIEVPSTGTLVVYGDLSHDYVSITLYNSDNQSLIYDANNWKENNITDTQNISMPIQLTKGTYFLSVKNGVSYNNVKGKLFIKFTPSKTVNYNSTLKGQLYRNETITYQVNVPYNGYFYLKGSFVESDRQEIEILDVDGQVFDNTSYYDDWFKNGASGLTDLKFKTKSFKAGTYYVKIKNKNYGNLSYNISLKTYIPATALKLNKYSIALKRGAAFQLKAAMGPTNTTDKLYWSSSNSKVAVVSSTGKVVAKGKGVAYIKAKTSSGLFKQVKVVVK